MTSCKGNIFHVTALCARKSPVTGKFHAQSPVTRNFDVFFDLHLNKWLSKQSPRRWFETPSRPLWRHCNALTWFSNWIPTKYIRLLASHRPPPHRWATELQWHQNDRDGILDQQPSLNRLFRYRSKKTSKFCVTGLCEVNSAMTGEFPAQKGQ